MTAFKRYTEFLFFQGIKLFFLLLPRKLSLGVGRILGLAVYSLDRRHRRIALSNLKTAFGSEFSASAQKDIARKSFIHFGKFLADFIKFNHFNDEKRDKLINAEGIENLNQAFEKGKGVLLFSGHYGSWEIAPYFLSRRVKFYVIARALDNDLLEKELLKMRANLGAEVIYKQQAAKRILQSLRAKEMVAVLIDQNVIRSQAVFVDFFGKAAATTPSLAAFFLRTQSPLVPVFCYPAPSNSYELKILKPPKINLTGDYEQDVLKITQICTKIIEAQIRRNPDYWLWFHQRWKTRPENETNQGKK
jgi:KDO2-lipid IV(A) lauroyltransferase